MEATETVKDDPVELLNLRPESSEPILYRAGWWWLWALVGPLLCLGAGILIGMSAPKQSGWFNTAALIPIAIGLGAGLLLSIGCSIRAFVRRERQALWSLLLALPSLTVVLWLLVLAGHYGFENFQRRQASLRQQKWQAQLRQDPEIALREKWYVAKDSRLFLLKNAFADSGISFTQEQLTRIYEEGPSMREDIFQSPACSRDFLAAHFSEAMERSKKYGSRMLCNIVTHPNAPIELVEQVARDPSQHSDAVSAAKRALKKRQTDVTLPR